MRRGRVPRSDRLTGYGSSGRSERFLRHAPDAAVATETVSVSLPRHRGFPQTCYKHRRRPCSMIGRCGRRAGSPPLGLPDWGKGRLRVRRNDVCMNEECNVAIALAGVLSFASGAS
eukprot:366346-Chlamydomonas_euryale.AAC.10